MIWLQLLKTAHVVSAAIIFGTGLGIAFFTWFGCRTALRGGSIDTLRAVLRYTVIADACFTAPAVAFQAASGILLMHLYRWPLDSDWSIAVWALFVLTGLFWLPVLWIQVRLHRDARAAPAVAALPRAVPRMVRARRARLRVRARYLLADGGETSGRDLSGGASEQSHARPKSAVSGACRWHRHCSVSSQECSTPANGRSREGGRRR